MKITTPRILPPSTTSEMLPWKIMLSFDITFLYTNIPIIDILNIIKDYVNDDQSTAKTAIPQDKFLDLVNLILTTT